MAQLGRCLLHVVKRFLETGVTPPSFSDGCVILVPKGDRDCANSSSWRPITFLNANRKLAAPLLVYKTLWIATIADMSPAV